MPKRKMTGGEIVTEYLIKEGVPYIFGVPGHGNMGFLNAVRAHSDKLKPILTRHEQIAAFMADGFYRVAHQPVATFSSCGPGSINILIGLAEAMSNSVPFLALTGNVPTSQFGAGALQETFFHQGGDFPQAIRGFCKRSFPVPRVDRLPNILGNAFRGQARTGQHRCPIRPLDGDRRGRYSGTERMVQIGQYAYSRKPGSIKESP